MLAIDQTGMPPKYHPYLHPPIRKIFLTEEDSDAKTRIADLEQQVSVLITERQVQTGQREIASKKMQSLEAEVTKWKSNTQYFEQLVLQERALRSQAQQRERVANSQFCGANVTIAQWMDEVKNRDAELGQHRERIAQLERVLEQQRAERQPFANLASGSVSAVNSPNRSQCSTGGPGQALYNPLPSNQSYGSPNNHPLFTFGNPTLNPFSTNFAVPGPFTNSDAGSISAPPNFASGAR